MYSFSKYLKRPKPKTKSEGSGNDNSSVDSKDNSLSGSKENNSTGEVRVDDEGYIIRPETTHDHKKNGDVSNFYSSSDDDSDGDEIGIGKPIHVVIKPLNNGYNSGGTTPAIEELTKTVQRLSISPSLQSVSQKRE